MITHISCFVCLLCVVLVNAKSNRIIGGDLATSGKIKYQVSVQVYGYHHCGGAIIADQYILSAAHCYSNLDGSYIQAPFQVVAGSTNLNSNQGVRIDVQKIYMPMKYVLMERSDDIAVLKLQRGLGLSSNPNLQKVDLPPIEEVSYVDETAVMAGYGDMHVDMRTNPKTGLMDEINSRRDGLLRYVTVKVVNNIKCHKTDFIWKRGLPKLERYQMCGETVQRGGDPEGISTGDTGGALVSGNTVIGVASFGPVGNNKLIKYTVYTKVGPHVGLIMKAMKGTKSTFIAVHEPCSGVGSSK